MSMTWPDHLLSLEEWEHLPEQERGRVELVEGVLQVSPQPVPRHQLLVPRLHAQLDAQLPGAWTAVVEVGVVLDTGTAPTVRIPDVVVMASAALDRPRLHPEEVLLAVEVASTGTRRTDRVMKLHEYARAGIPHYWIVDGAELDEFVLGDDEQVYEHHGTHRGVVALPLDGRGAALTVAIDLNAATRGT